MTENLNLKTVETVDTRPFRKLVMTIGELPTSFVESMTYYELLAWFTNYLETVIIPTVNNNGEAVEELQEKYVELKTNTEQEITDFETELTTLFNQLQDYVDNYFNNLDVQEEINNKLDAMAEAGTLQEIITQYINTTALWMFDNVAGMKLATNFTNGSFARTLGFYNKGDKGGATYKIRTKTNDDTADEMTLIALSDSTLIAELIKTNVMNVKQFGAKGDGSNDDTTFIQTALNNSVNVTIPSGTYMIDAETTLLPNNNNRIVLDNDAILKAIPNNLETYRIIHIVNRNNIEICGGTIEGERSNHDGDTGEWGVGIRIAGTSNNIYIHDINIKNTWGDGITVFTSGTVKTEKVHIDNARRNGISVIKVNEYISNDDIIENTNGTNPQAAVDIEPDTNTDQLNRIVINNMVSKNNAGAGMKMFLIQDNTTPVSININNFYDYGSKNGIEVAKHQNRTGEINIINPYLEHQTDAGILLWRCYDGEMILRLIRPYIIDCNQNEFGVQYGSCITGYVQATETDLPIGNIEIIEPYLQNHVTNINTCISLRHYGTSDPQLNRIKIIDPIYTQGRNIYLGKNTNTFFSDKYNQTAWSSTSNYTLQVSEYHSVYTNRSDTADNRIFTIPDTTWVGQKFKVQNMNSSHTLSVRIPTSEYCYQLSNAANTRIILNKIGDMIELTKISSNVWVISDINCTPTVQDPA